MSTQVIRPRAESPVAADRFVSALVFAIVAHATVILGVSFGVREKTDAFQPPQTIEVTLVNSRSDEEPEDVDYLAQANQEGGGNTTDQVRPQTLLPSTMPSDKAQITSPVPPVDSPPPQERAERAELLTTKNSSREVASDVFPAEKKRSEKTSVAELVSRSMDIASLEAEVGQSMQAYSKLPRQKFVTASTKEYKYAAYMEAWRTKVERIGNLNFPAEAKRRKLTGSLILDVAVNSDGTLNHVAVSKSSGSNVLDDAAMRIVHLSSPFAPFPDEIRKEVDVLHITRTWKFAGGEVATGT